MIYNDGNEEREIREKKNSRNRKIGRIKTGTREKQGERTRREILIPLYPGVNSPHQKQQPT